MTLSSHPYTTRKVPPMPSSSNQKRDRLGRYAELHPCYVCGKSAGEKYFSDRRTDTLTPTGEDFGDIALCLCGDCADKGEAMPDAEAFAFYSSGKRWAE